MTTRTRPVDAHSLPAAEAPPARPRLERLGAGLRRLLPFASGVAAALAALLIYRWLFPPPAPLTLREVNHSVAQALASATPRAAFSVGVYQVIQPSLVLIQTQGALGREDGGLGSGVVVNDQGAILTSLHVVAGASQINLIFADGTHANGLVLAEMPENDIAVLQADRLPSVLVPAVLGNPNSLRVGDEAYAVGNPFGLYSSMSAGVISGLDRSFQPPGSEFRLEGLIQIDAAVNPGNSGGPLVNRFGHVVGIVTALINPSDQDVFIGIGFAVPINLAAAGAGLPPIW